MSDYGDDYDNEETDGYYDDDDEEAFYEDQARTEGYNAGYRDGWNARLDVRALIRCRWRYLRHWYTSNIKRCPVCHHTYNRCTCIPF